LNRIFSKILICFLILSPVRITDSGRVTLSQGLSQAKEQRPVKTRREQKKQPRKTRRHEFQIDLKQGKATLKPLDDSSVKRRAPIFTALPTTAVHNIG